MSIRIVQRTNSYNPEGFISTAVNTKNRNFTFRAATKPLSYAARAWNVYPARLVAVQKFDILAFDCSIERVGGPCLPLTVTTAVRQLVETLDRVDRRTSRREHISEVQKGSNAVFRSCSRPR